MKTYKKGISLIVLVITVLVLAILATTVIISLSNTNIITKANEAVVKSRFKSMQEQLALYVADQISVTNGAFKIEDLNADAKSAKIDEIFPELKDTKYYDYVSLVDGKIVIADGMPDREIAVATIGDNLVKWVMVANEDNENIYVTNGTKKLTVGEVVNYYDEQGNKFKSLENPDEDVEWRVLGADEAGNLLIVSADRVQSYLPGSHWNWSAASPEEIVNEVNNSLKVNGQLSYINAAQGAINSRSIDADDIDRITGYVKEGKGEGFNKYGARFDYTREEKEIDGVQTTFFTIKCIEENIEKSFDTSLISTFTLPYEVVDGIEATRNENWDRLTFSLVETAYEYNLTEYISNASRTDNVYSTLYNGDKYWLATAGVDVLDVGEHKGASYVVNWGPMYINSDKVGTSNVYGIDIVMPEAWGMENGYYGVRAVVEFSPNVTVNEGTNGNWDLIID